MNRRELFKSLAASFAAASIPIPFPVETIEQSPSDALSHLLRVRLDLIDQLLHPPCVMYEDGRIEIMKDISGVRQEALRHVTKMIEELEKV